MERAGQRRIVNAEDVAVMGVSEIISKLPTIYSSYRKLVKSIRENRPDVAVLIDFPDINFRLAKHLHKANVPIIWFVSPQLWAWKRKRLKAVQMRVSRMLCIFPFEERFYRERGVDAEFVGHPLLELSLPQITREHYAAQHHLDPNKTWIALLPGSRWKELHANLPALHELAMSDLIASSAAQTTFDGADIASPRDPAAQTHYEFLLPVASTINTEELRDYLNLLNAEHLKYMGPEANQLRLTLVPDAAEALLHARASVVASGTATVQAAVIGNPFVVVYRVSSFTYQLIRRLVRYPAEFADMRAPNGDQPISMVNLIAQRRVVPELLQGNFTAANVASALAPLLVDGPERDAQIEGLAEVRRTLRAGSPAERAQPTPPPFTIPRRSAINRVANAVMSFLPPASTPEAVESTSKR